MSYGIIRMEKFQAGDVKGIQNHDKREAPSRSNPDINTAQSHENYSLIECNNYHAAIKERLATLESKKAVRKDAVVMCQLLVTSDSEFFKSLRPDQQREFFKQALQFVQNRYGKENVFSATVHMDEKTPHLNVSLTPIKAGRLTAKTIFDRNELTALHDDFARKIGATWGLKRGENREEKRRHLSGEAFKLKMRKQELKDQADELGRIAGSSLIRPTDLDSRVLEKGFLTSVKENAECIAHRLNETYVRPLLYKREELQRNLSATQEALHREQAARQQMQQAAQNYQKLTQGLTQQQIQALLVAVEETRKKNQTQKAQERAAARQHPARGRS